MLINFSVENFRSISERQSLILEASSDAHLRYNNVIEAPANYQLLKSAVLYGANASGKSNILNAINWMRRFVLESLSKRVEQAGVSVETNRLREDQRDGASVFELEFLVREQEERFRYGFAVSGSGVEEEWLFRKRARGPEACIFEREGQNIFPNLRQEKGLELLVSRTRPNALFLKVCAEFNSKFAEQIMDWFRNLRFLSGLDETTYFNHTAELMLDKENKQELLQYIQRADFNICDVESKIEPFDEKKLPDDMPINIKKAFIAKLPKKVEINTSHKIYNSEGSSTGTEKLDLRNDESNGTCKFVAMAGPMLRAIEEGSILVIDEFEARLHPNLTKAILKWFHGPQNDKGAQLIIATHDTGLMIPDILRRDQIWFCEKDGKGSTSLYCLDEFNKQDVRATTKFNRQYLEGIFGAVPQIALDEFSVSHDSVSKG